MICARGMVFLKPQCVGETRDDGIIRCVCNASVVSNTLRHRLADNHG